MIVLTTNEGGGLAFAKVEDSKLNILGNAAVLQLPTRRYGS